MQVSCIQGPCPDFSLPVLKSNKDLMSLVSLINEETGWLLFESYYWPLSVTHVGNSNSKMVSLPWQGSSNYIHWLLQACDGAIVEVTGELAPTVAISVDVDTEVDGEEEGFSTDTANLGDSVGAEIMRSRKRIGSLYGRIHSCSPVFHAAFTDFTNVCLSVGAVKWLMCCSLITRIHECTIGRW